MLYFDIGAYVGEKTAEFLQLGATVVAVEPNPETFVLLTAKYENNPQVHLVNRAVSDHIGHTTLSVPTCNLMTLCTLKPQEWYTGRWSGLTEAKQFKVKTTTLDALIRCYGQPDFAKIDAEGSEANILRGLSHRIPRLTFEYRSDHIGQVVHCLRLLERHGKFKCGFSRGDTWDGAWYTPIKLLKVLRHTIVTEPELWGDIIVRY